MYLEVLYGIHVLFHIIQYYVILFTLICNSYFRHSIIHDTFLIQPTECIILYCMYYQLYNLSVFNFKKGPGHKGT